MASQLLGNSYRRPEPLGKGLKLEETWQPPPEKDDGKDDDEDGEGEDEDKIMIWIETTVFKSWK